MKSHADLDIFHAVLDAGTFSGAAKHLGITHSAVSKRIAQLERRLGAQLLLRSTRQMRLTDVGETYALETRELMERLHAVERDVIEGNGALKGHIRMTCSNALGKLHVMPLLLAFMDRYPDVVIDLTLTDAVVDLVHERMDLAIRSAAHLEPGLVARRLATNHRVVCAAACYLERHGTPNDTAELAGHLCLSLNLPGSFNAWGLTSANDSRHGLLSNSLEVLHAACLHGRGIACLPHYLIADDLAAGRLTPLLEEERGAAIDSSISLVRPESAILPRRVRVLIDFLVEEFER